MTSFLIQREPRDRAATTALFLSAGFGAGSFAANLPRLQEAHGLSDGQLGLLLLALGLGAVATMLLAGRLAAAVGSARVAGVAGLLGAPLLPAFAALDGWVTLLVAGLLLGAVNGTMDVAMNARASAVERRWGAAIMSSFHAGWSGGGLLGAAFAGAMAGLGATLVQSLLAAAVIIALLAGAGLSQRTREAAPPGGTGFVLPSRALATVCLMAALCFAAEGAVSNWSGVYLRTELGTDAAFATSAFGAYSLAMALGRIAGDGVVRWLGPVWVMRLGAGVAGVGLGGALLAHNPWVADAAFVLSGLGLSNLVPVMFSAAGRLRGTLGVAMMSTTGYAGGLIAPPVLGAVADATSLRVALGLMLPAMACIAAAAASVMAPQQRAMAER
jgi:MFS family permease